jgi:hypothetical protein
MDDGSSLLTNAQRIDSYSGEANGGAICPMVKYSACERIRLHERYSRLCRLTLHSKDSASRLRFFFRRVLAHTLEKKESLNSDIILLEKL